MRYRLMATYQGVPYEAGIGPSDGDVVLFAACPPPEDLGFEPATGHWRKQLRVQDVQALWESRPMGRYRGQRCLVLDDLGDRLHIAYLGHDAYQALQLGYWQVDRGVFELVTPRDEVTDVTEERFDYPEQPLSAGSYQPAAADSGPADADSGPATADFGSLPSDYKPAPAVHGAPAAGYRPGAADLGTSAGYGPAAVDSAASTADHGSPAADPGPSPTGYGSPAAGYGPSAATGYESAAADYGPVTAEFRVRTPAGLTPAPVPPDTGPFSSPGRPVPTAPDMPSTGFTVLPPSSEPPLPLEAAALRAASAASTPKQSRLTSPAPAPSAFPAPSASPAPPVSPDLRAPGPDLPTPGPAGAAPRRRRSARSRMATQGIFIELATLAAIPSAAYAVGEEVDGALCLIETDTGYEVFSAAGGARHEVRAFEDEESAYFYLFGVLAAEAVRTGLLIPHR